ncbi:Crp/Fnr family transcriptional regulator [Chryseobacterium nematophagum]|uniref:Crp/Fnr family transcriptional regulator n=1 Tax=Chryseobacterium nematophagum TaxID=2305228 RepID=A0A3M7L7Z5_9FLAO|nr:Crp/Fnr family transcriptional regulator [Chryseobacterium nematophagum]RMZ58727.1 Crp/Fnr family transcriptional regulator [Chryseobacterium nematophagum]
MIINEKNLNLVGAETKEYNSGEYIFQEGDPPLYCYYIVEGEVKLNSYNKDGKEFILNILTNGQTFGESFLFINKIYPMDAIALRGCTIMRLCKKKFDDLLKLHPHLCFDICKSLSERLYYQYLMLRSNSSQNPAERITGVMDYFKCTEEDQTQFSFKVPLTRQQLASFTGMCLETAIRTVKTLEKDGKIKIENRKILY